MKQFKIQNMTVESDKAKNQLLAFLNRMNEWPYINKGMELAVSVDNNGDFVFLEAKTYNVAFFSNAHKLKDLYDSEYWPVSISFEDFRNRVLSLCDVA